MQTWQAVAAAAAAAGWRWRWEATRYTRGEEDKAATNLTGSAFALFSTGLAGTPALAPAAGVRRCRMLAVESGSPPDKTAVDLGD